MKELFQRLKGCLQRGEDVVLITVISEPNPGASVAIGKRMLFSGTGLLYGTIDNGYIGGEVKGFAIDILRDKNPYTKSLRFKYQRTGDLDFARSSGDGVQIFFQFMSASDWRAIAIVEGILNMLERDVDSWIITDISEGAPWNMGVYSESKIVTGLELKEKERRPLFKNDCLWLSIGDKRYYSEPLVQATKIVRIQLR